MIWEDGVKRMDKERKTVSLMMVMSDFNHVLI